MAIRTKRPLLHDCETFMEECEMRKFIIQNWTWLAIGFVLTLGAVVSAYVERGYVGFGGEWLVFPAVLLLARIARK